MPTVHAATVRPAGRLRTLRSGPTIARVDDLEGALLGEAPVLTRVEVVEQAGVGMDRARAVWAAMGFAEVPEGVAAFTRADVEALRTASSLVEGGLIDADTLLVMARAMGQGLSRLAEAQVDVLRSLSGGMTVDEALSAALSSADEVVPRLEELVLFVWRRQFAAAVHRSVAAARQDGMPLVAIGFVDLVDFTRSSRHWDAGQLGRTLEHFERDTALRVTAVGGRVVKTLGDGVLFSTGDVRGAVEVALDTVAAHEADPELPSVRAGIAMGAVLVRLGDVFGQPVNLASRLTDEARPGSVLVDEATSQALADVPELQVRVLRRRSVRGYRALTPYLVRRRPD